MRLEIKHRQLLVNAHSNHRRHNATAVVNFAEIPARVVLELGQHHKAIVVQHIAVLRVVRTRFYGAVDAL